MDVKFKNFNLNISAALVTPALARTRDCTRVQGLTHQSSLGMRALDNQSVKRIDLNIVSKARW